MSVTVVLGTSAVEITPDPIASNVTDLIPKSQIIGVYPVLFQKKPNNSKLKIDTVVGAFDLGETVTGGTSGATGVIFGFLGMGGLFLQSVVGEFQVGETITGGTSGATANTVSVEHQSYENEWNYKYPTMTVIEILTADERRFNVELQDVSNQATWNLGTLAAQQQAVADINAWL